MKHQSTIEDLRRELQQYSAEVRHPDLPKLFISDFYDLHPPENPPKTLLCWPDDWPHGDSAGVYVILDNDYRISYIGKASMNSWLAARLSTYFVYDENKRCKLKHPSSWELSPRYVAVIPMNPSYRFEAPALEEYLLDKLRPPDNKAGT